MAQDQAADDNAFRDEVRAFLSAELTPELQRAGRNMTSVFADFDAALSWHSILYRKGWVAPDWPVEYGGTGWSPSQRQIFHEQLKLNNAPALMALGLQMLGPIVMHYGTEQHKAEYLPRILSGEDIWCQGYSEPGAGSDLASLSTRAVRDGDDYIVNGTKIWTSFAHRANKIFCLVRTSTAGKPQAGISFLLADMDTDGITVSEIVGLDGRVEQCQVFFDNVRIPVANRLGGENEGWNVAKYLLQFERGGHNYSVDHKKLLAKVRRIASDQIAHDGTVYIDDGLFSRKLAELEIDALALQLTEQRIKSMMDTGGNDAGSLTSVSKLAGTELSQQITELSVEALGVYNVPLQVESLAPNFDGDIVGPEYGVTTFAEYINTRASTIYGGSAEIQRNIIARTVLAL